MAKIECFEDLNIWKMAREICRDVCRITRYDEFSRDYKFKEQIRDSSGSVMDNIAEGFERGGNKEFVQFLAIAKGSSGETRSQLHRSFDYQYIEEEEYNLLCQKARNISKSISALMDYLKKSEIKGTKYKI